MIFFITAGPNVATSVQVPMKCADHFANTVP